MEIIAGLLIIAGIIIFVHYSRKSTEVHFEIADIRSTYDEDICFSMDSTLEDAEVTTEEVFHDLEAVVELIKSRMEE